MNTLRQSMSQILITLYLVLACCFFAGAEEKKVGYLLPLTGDAAVFGTEVQRGIIIAQEALKQEGISVPVLFEDDQCLSKNAVIGWQRLTEVEQVSVVVGPVCSATIMATSPIAKSKKRPLFALWDAGPAVESQGSHVFSLGFDTEGGGEIVAKYLLKNQLNRIAVLWEEDAYAQVVKEAFEKSLLLGGGKITSSISFHSDEKNFASLIAKVLTHDPDALFLSPAYGSVALIKALRNLKVQKPVFGNDTYGYPGILETAEEAMEGMNFSNFELSSSSPKVREFLQIYEKRFGSKPTSIAFAAFGYDSLKIAVQLPADRTKQVSALETLEWEGVLPVSNFHHGRMVKLPSSLFTVKNGSVLPLLE